MPDNIVLSPNQSATRDSRRFNIIVTLLTVDTILIFVIIVVLILQTVAKP